MTTLKAKTKNRTPVGPLKNVRGEAVTDKKKMAEILNSYFSSIFTIEGDGAVPAAESADAAMRLEQIQVDQDRVRKKLRELKPGSAPGPDGIGALLLKELAEQVVGPLTTIYKASLSSGEVPDDWRRAHVTPIHKKGSKSDPANYRPVSLTSVSCKVLESIIRDELVSHMTDNGLIKESQHRFVKGRSCATNLVEFFDYVSEAVDGGGSVDAIFLDFAKAFDKVPKKRLLEKLRSIGVGGQVLTWIESWLMNCKQHVVIDGEGLGWEDAGSRVPQGSVLGPVLFLVFIRDLDRATTASGVKLRKFADDTKVAKKVSGGEDRAELQSVLDGMMEWSQRWGMEFNHQKCKVMHFGIDNTKHQYRMGDHVL
jgi:Reverse transcriptase (RNA-dependent DNA polymerase)